MEELLSVNGMPACFLRGLRRVKAASCNLIVFALMWVVIGGCGGSDESSPWVLIYRDTQDQESYLDVSRVEFKRREGSVWISRNVQKKDYYQYQRILIRFGQGQIMIADSMRIRPNGKIEFENVEPVWRKVGAVGLDRVLFDLISPEGTPQTTEEIQQKARSIEEVLLRLSS